MSVLLNERKLLKEIALLFPLHVTSFLIVSDILADYGHVIKFFEK